MWKFFTQQLFLDWVVVQGLRSFHHIFPSSSFLCWRQRCRPQSEASEAQTWPTYITLLLYFNIRTYLYFPPSIGRTRKVGDSIITEKNLCIIWGKFYLYLHSSGFVSCLHKVSCLPSKYWYITLICLSVFRQYFFVQ